MYQIHVTDYSSAIERKELLIHTVIWRNLEIVMLNERSQTEKSIYEIYIKFRKCK